MKLSVIVPAHNEEGCIEPTVRHLSETLVRQAIEHEILVVNDHSTDRTDSIVTGLLAEIPTLRLIQNTAPKGFGDAVRTGLDQFAGEAAAIFMADASDSPDDLVPFFRTMVDTNSDCVFGSRFIEGGHIVGYPRHKLLVNRAANWLIRFLFQIQYNDATNAFKLYRRNVIDELRPYSCHHFDLSLELSLKAIIRGYRYRVVPNSWSERRAGHSKFNLIETCPLYLRVLQQCFIERWFTKKIIDQPDC